MTTTISQPVRIAALLGLAAALALGGALMVLGRHTTSPTAPVVPKQHPRTAVIAPSAPAQSEPSVKPATKPAAPVSTRPAAEVAALKAGLPLPLAEALGRHPVVVVEITDPQSELDSIALAEAQAGAATARAGFVSLNVLSKAEIGKLTRVAQLTSPPLSEALKVTLKVSNNLYASTLPLLLAAKNQQRTLAAGMRQQQKQLAALGLDTKTISFGGAAGGDRADKVSPRATVQLLLAMRKRPDFVA